MSKKGSGKRRRTEVYRYELQDPTEARAALRAAQFAATRTPTADTSAAVESAKAAVRDCYGTITLQAIAPAEWAVLRQELAEVSSTYAKAVREATEAGGPAPALPESTWLEDSVEVRMLAACDADGDHTAAWWAQEFVGADWSEAERDELVSLCFQANSPAQIDLSVLGKG